MFRILLCAVCTFLWVGWGSTAPAQHEFSVYGEGGVAVPRVTTQFQDFYSKGQYFGVGVGYVVTPSVEIVVRATRGSFSLNEEGVNDFIPEVDARVEGSAGTVSSATVDVRFHTALVERLDFYLSGGLGPYRQAIYGVELTNKEQEDDTFVFGAQEQISAGLNYGFGFALPVGSGVELSVNSEFVLIFGESIDEQLAREKTGQVGFFTVRGGVGWTL